MQAEGIRRNAGRFRHVFARGQNNCRRAPALSALPHAGGARGAIAIAALARNSSWEQRREALSRGIRHMEWTFDPLEIKNAFLNIHRLGAISREYRVDFYGVSSSRLQGGLPTDRLLAEWELDSPRVEAVLWSAARQLHARSKNAFWFRPPLTSGRPAKRTANGPSLFSWRIDRSFNRHFPRGLAVLGFSLDAEGNGVFELGPLSQRPEFDHEERYEN